MNYELDLLWAILGDVKKQGPINPVEAAYNWRFFVDLAEQYAQKGILANSYELKAFAKRHKKTDKIDARLIMFFCIEKLPLKKTVCSLDYNLNRRPTSLPSGKRGISKEIARKLSNFFKVPIDRFI